MFSEIIEIFSNILSLHDKTDFSKRGNFGFVTFLCYLVLIISSIFLFNEIINSQTEVNFLKSILYALFLSVIISTIIIFLLRKLIFEEMTFSFFILLFLTFITSSTFFLFKFKNHFFDFFNFSIN